MRRAERFHLSLLAVTMLVFLVRPTFAQDAVGATGDYETPGPVNAGDFLPKSAFGGKRLFVQKTARNNGLQNIYLIRAGAEEYEITGSEPELLTNLRSSSFANVMRNEHERLFARLPKDVTG